MDITIANNKIDYDQEIKKLENAINILKDKKNKEKNQMFKPINIDIDEIRKNIEQMKKEGRWFEPGDDDYEESLKHPWGVPKQYWYTKK
jgi:predicted Rossmann fold nucleotide-binding protein DprA/Smf involved in DNA uptake